MLFDIAIELIFDILEVAPVFIVVSFLLSCFHDWVS